MTLGIVENLSKSFEFAKDGLVGHWVRWILLIIISAIPIVNFIAEGYVVKIYRGGDVAPEFKDYIGMFIDGLKLTIINLVYLIIPLIIIQAGEFFGLEELSTTGVALMVIGTILALVVSLFALIAAVRFAKTESMKEAFNFNAILEKIQEIGWKHYILSYIVFIVVLSVIVGILSGSGFALMFYSNGSISAGIGSILALVLLILVPFFLIWQGKFYENLYSLA
jgi:hypothetical protein